MRIVGKPRLVTKSAFLLALCLTVSLVLSGPASSAKAVYINNVDNPALLSKYSSMIDWIDWSQARSDGGVGIREYDKNKLKARQHPRENIKPDIEQYIPKDKTYSVESRRNVSANRVLVTSCSVKSVLVEVYPDGGDKNPPRDLGIALHEPGSYHKDPFDDFYGKGHLVGVGRSDEGHSAMDVWCSSKLQDQNGRVISDVPIEGLVFSDGETTNRRTTTNTSGDKTYYQREFFEMTPYVPDPKKSLEWRLLEYKPGEHCGPNEGTIEIRRGPDEGHYRKFHGRNIYERSHLYNTNRKALKVNDNVRVRGWDGPCDSRANDKRVGRQPLTTVYAEGATGAYLHLYGSGGNYVAVGVVLGVDFGDAPDTYGVAGAVIQPSIANGVIPKFKGSYGGRTPGHNVTRNSRDISWNDNLEKGRSPSKSLDNGASYNRGLNVASTMFASNPAQISYERIPYLGEHGPDGDLTQDEYTGSDSNQRHNFIFDDKDSFNAVGSRKTGAHLEEDALGADRKNLLVYVGPHTYDLNISCHADSVDPAYVYGWLDWNGNGTFEDNEKATKRCELGQDTTKLSWTIDQARVDALPVGVTKSALRLIATTDQNVAPVGITSDGEVEDHAVTLVRPKLTLQKQLTDQNGAVQTTPSPELLEGWNFTAKESEKISAASVPDAGLPTAVTDNTGSAEYQLKLKTNHHLPLDIRDNTDIADLKFTEIPRKNYSLKDFSAADCQVKQKPNDWDNLTGNPSAYPWPDQTVPQISSQAGVITVSGIKPTSVVTCNVKNQPAGTFSITPTVRVDATLDTGSVLKSDIKFVGTFTCSKQGEKDVNGNWGPIASGETWTYENSATNPSIPLGAKCAVTQKVTESDGGTELSAPVEGPDHDLYIWGPVKFALDGVDSTADATATAGNATLVNGPNNTVPNFGINYPVVKRTTSVSWTKVNLADTLLEGAEFSLKIPGEANPIQITDCVANSDADCTGSDKNPEAGEFRIDKLSAGTGYVLTETKAPLGYKIGETKTFEIVNYDIRKNGKNLGGITNEPYSSEELPTLPLTGGASTDSFLIAGGLVGLLSLGLAYAAKRRRARA